MSNHLYENSTFVENSSTLRSSTVQPMRRGIRHVIAFSVLITIGLVLSFSALVIALLPIITNEDTDTAATLQKNKTEENVKYLEMVVMRLDSENKELVAALNQTQERLKLLENSTAVRFQEVDSIVNPTGKGEFSCYNLKTE